MKWKPLGWWEGDHSKANSWEDARGPQSKDPREVATQGVPERIQDKERSLRDEGLTSRCKDLFAFTLVQGEELEALNRIMIWSDLWGFLLHFHYEKFQRN